jgi:PAS domain S-box-containing protein
MMRNFNRWLILAIIAILASGLILTLWTVQREDHLLHEDLLAKTHILQQGYSSGYLNGLTGTEKDLVSTDYQALKKQLIQVKSAHPEIRFVYLIGQKPDGTVFFFVDSEPPESPDYSPPGQVYSEAGTVLLQTFASGEATTGGPVTDRWGTWVSGFIPIRNSTTGNVVAVFGADMDSRDGDLQIIKASAGAVVVLLLLLLLVLIFVYMQQRNEREREILASSEAALRESENRYRKVFESTGTAMVIIEDDTTISLANNEFFRLTGYTPADISRTMSWTEFVVKDDLDRMKEQHRLRCEKPEGSMKQYEFRLVTKSGDIRHILLTIDLLPGTTRSVASLMDMTEQKEIHAVLERHASEQTRNAEVLRQTNDKLNLLNSITRHDILNQLTAILGYLELTKMKYPDPQLQEFIHKEIQAAETIKTQIMFTKDYQNIGVRSPQWFDLKKVILSSAALLPLSSMNLDVDCDTLEIYADPMLEKVFYTLLENALRHSTTITTIGFSCRTGAEGLVVTCQDNGEGIPAEVKEAIFEHRYFKHTGFGLFLSRAILGITGIKIRETGEPGKGARFEIIVPEGAYRFTTSESNQNKNEAMN